MLWRAAFSKRLTDWPLLAAIGVSLVGAALRIPPLGESLWLDELHTAWCAVGPLDEVARRAAIGNQGPLFFWMEWLAFGILGPSELSLRLMSFVSGSLLPPAVFFFARRWKVDAAGLVAAGLLAVDPLSIFFATEARPYAALQLLVVVHVALTAEIADKPTLRMRMAWIFVAAALFYLHYTSALIVVANGVFLLLTRIVRPHKVRAAMWTVLLDLATIGVLCLPQAGVLQAIFAHRTNWAAFVARQPIWKAIDWFSLPAWWWGVLMVTAVLGVGLRARTGVSPSRFLRDHVYLLVMCWLAIPIGIAWLATSTDTARLFFPRYLVCVLPAGALLAGLWVYAIEWPWPRIVMGIVTVAYAAWSGGVVENIVHRGSVIEPRGEDWRGCVVWLNGRLQQTQFPVLAFSGLIEADELRQPHDELLEDYCLAPVNSLYPLDANRGDVFPLPLHEPGRLDQVAEMLVVHRGGAWLIVRGDEKKAAGIADQIAAYLRRAAVPETSVNWRVEDARSFGKVQVLLLGTDATRHGGPSDPSVAGP